MRRLPVKRLTKVQFFYGITTLQVWPYLGTSKCWGHSVLQTPAPGVGRNTLFLSSPHLCFIIVFICDLFVYRDDPLMS